MRIERLCVGILAIAIVVAFDLIPAYAQDDLEQRLTGSASREWVFKRIVRSMGSGSACSSGLTYTFEQRSRALTVRHCKNGNLETSRYTWHLSDDSTGDTTLVVERFGTFVLLFRDAPDGSHFLRLRTQGRAPTEPTEDREFRMGED